MGDLDMPSCALDLPDCFSGLGGLPDLPEDSEAITADSLRGADVMFSSSLSFLDNKAPRNRDNSLTLSECADSLFKDLDILGTSPNSSNNLNAFFDTPMASECGSDTDQEEEEEIEVVDNKTIVSNNTTYYVSGSKKSQGKVGSRAGRSLLRKNNKKTAPSASYTDRPGPSSSILESAQLDHCYSSQTPPPEEESTIPHGHNSLTTDRHSHTPLTPTASSDDEYERGRQGCRQSLLGKRKHSESVSGMDDGELKFKFRMKFGSSYSPQRRGLSEGGDITVESDYEEEEEEEETHTRHGPKRRSAMKNAHCPSPTKEQPSRPAAVSPPSPAAKAATAGSLKALRKAVSSRPAEERSASARRSTEGGTEQKCRELRDLHNSMERQRRVDLKINFDQLKDKVPELRDTDKASKMVILNKAAEYSRLLLKTDLVLTSERDRVARRNAELRQRLEAAKRSCYGGGLGFGSISRPSISSRRHHGHPSLIRY